MPASPTRSITLPYRIKFRDYQLPAIQALTRGTKRAYLNWHRRSGKDVTSIGYVQMEAWKRVGIYYHFFPTYSQGKKAIWDGIDDSGRPFLSYFPKELVANRSENEMQIRFINGSIYQIVGTDKYDAVRGTNPVGCVFSEYSRQNPAAWDVVRPILNANGGWAIFASTPNGKNHAYSLFQAVKSSPEWFVETLTIDETRRENGKPLITAEMVEQDRLTGMEEEVAQQEYWCAWNIGAAGSYYGSILAQSQEEGRITDVPWNPMQTVDTAWDLGYGDSTAIWFVQQQMASRVNVIDYFYNQGKGIEYYAKILKEREYAYRSHYAPPDISAGDVGIGKSRIEIGRSLGIRFRPVLKIPLSDGLAAVRILLRKCFFDKNKCADGLDALTNYHKEWDAVKKCYRDNPVHDWASDGSDAFRTLAVGLDDRQDTTTRQETAESDWSIFASSSQAERRV